MGRQWKAAGFISLAVHGHRRTRSAAPWGVVSKTNVIKEGRNVFAHAHGVTMESSLLHLIGSSWTWADAFRRSLWVDKLSEFVVILETMESESSSYPNLRFLSDIDEIVRFQNRLPHWQQDRGACFITFRMTDSIPSELLTHWRRERDAWMLKNPKPWSPEIEMVYHTQFSSRFDRWMDEGRGSCLLGDPLIAAILSEILEHGSPDDYLLHSWVIMPNHVHLLISLNSGQEISRMVAGWKRFSATRINKIAGRTGSFWQKDYFDRLIRDWDHFINVSRYIRNNPKKAKLDAGFVLYEAPWVKKLLS